MSDGDIGARVEALLAEIEQSGGAVAAARTEELVRELLDYYGEGLSRFVAVVAAERPDLIERAAEDPLVSSQLILHDLHPLSADQRIERALDRVRPYLGSHAGGVHFLGVDQAGVAKLRLDGSCSGCPSSTVTVRLTIEEAVLAAAPELTSIEVEGVVEQSPTLLQIGMRPREESAEPPVSWVRPSAAQLPDPGSVAVIMLADQPIAMCRLGDVYYAYADDCPACHAGFHRQAVYMTRAGQSRVRCAGCGAEYDVQLAGRAVDGSGRHLDPYPVLDDAEGLRVALPPAAGARSTAGVAG